MSSSDPSPEGRTPLRRFALWAVIALMLVIGLAMYFRFGRDIAPVLGGGQ